MSKLTDVERVSQSCHAFSIPWPMRRKYVRMLATRRFEDIHAEIVEYAALAHVRNLRSGREAIAAVKAQRGVTP